MAEEIRKSVLNLEIPHEKSLPLGIVSLSLGVATLGSNESLSHEKLLTQADKALYIAKENGRNRVEIYDEID